MSSFWWFYIFPKKLSHRISYSLIFFSKFKHFSLYLSDYFFSLFILSYRACFYSSYCFFSSICLDIESSFFCILSCKNEVLLNIFSLYDLLEKWFSTALIDLGVFLWVFILLYKSSLWLSSIIPLYMCNSYFFVFQLWSLLTRVPI